MQIKRSKITVKSGSSKEKGNSSLLIFYILYFKKKSINILLFGFFPLKMLVKKLWLSTSCCHFCCGCFTSDIFKFL